MSAWTAIACCPTQSVSTGVQREKQINAWKACIVDGTCQENGERIWPGTVGDPELKRKKNLAWDCW